MAPGSAGDAELQYYKHRVAAFDADRQDLLDRVEACASATPAEVYKMQAESRKRTEEVRELQKALSDAHTYLFEERERLLAMQAENDGLRLQEVEDRARIKQLLALTRPVEQKVVYGGGNSTSAGGGSGSIENGPHCNAIFPRGGGRGRNPATAAAARPGGPPPPAPPPERILRTVYLPTAQAEALALKCEALQAQLAEQRRFAAERIAALQEDRGILQRDAAAHAAAQGGTIDELADKLRGAEEALRRTTRDYILARQQRDTAQQEAAAARAAAAAAERRGREAAEEARERAAAAQQQLRAELEADCQAATRGLQAELAQRQEELLKFETLHKLIRVQLEVRASEAERRASRLAARSRELQLRRAQEMEGWANDVGQLRKRIAAVDRRLKQMSLEQRLPDDARRDAVLARHARLAPSDYEYECSLDDLVEELLGIKDSLLGMGERVRRQQQQQQEQEPAHSGGGCGGSAGAALRGAEQYDE